jgi:hypothetical protein
MATKVKAARKPIELSKDDDRRLRAMCYAILDAAAARQVSRGEAMAAFAHIIAAAAIGNEGEFRRWLRPEMVARWVDLCDEARCPDCGKKPCVLAVLFSEPAPSQQ